MKVYEALARAFVAEGATAVFGMMGDANMYWMNSLDELGVELLEVRHEGAGLAMADGFGRIAGVPGVCTATSGPGVAQLATTLLVAARARTPLVAFVGQTVAGDDEAPQRLDQRKFADACECAFVPVTSADDAYEAVQKAFYLAKTESRPVMLNAPMDVQQQSVDEDDQYVTSDELIKPYTVYPDPAKIAEAAEVVARSRKPVIVVGRGAQRSGAGDAILQLAENTGALIATTLMAKTWLSEDEYHVGISGLYSTKTAMGLFQDADVVIAVGASLNKFTTEHGYLYPGATYIQFDAQPHVVMGGNRTADLYVHSDARLGIEQLHQALLTKGVHHNEGFRTPAVKDMLATAFEDNEPYELEDTTVDPRRVCELLDEKIPAEIGLVIGGGQNICFSTILMKRRRDLVLANQHFGCIGQGLTTAMGAVKASGNKPAFLVEGDAGFMMHLPEFETAVRYGMPLLVVIFNDQLLGAEYHKARVKGLNADLARITTPDLGEVGRALGGRGSLVRSLDQLAAAVDEFVADPAPTLVDVRISTNVISIPYRRLHFGQDA
jgi:acetolactate synthase-1/2/3 large subunit